VNQQIRRLSGVAMILLAALIVATTYWTTWARADLAAKQDNAIKTSCEQFRLIVYGRSMAV